MSRVRPARRLDGLGVTLLRRILAEAPADALHLGIGVSNIDVPASVRDAIAAAPARANYGPNAGDPELRAAIGRLHGVAPERVIVTHGVQQGLSLAMLGTVDPGDVVLVPGPGFPVYGTLAELAGARVARYALRAEDGFRPTWAVIDAALRAGPRPAAGGRTHLVLCSPGNPTGAIARSVEWRALLAGAVEAGVAVISDEIYLPLSRPLAPFGGADEAGVHPSALALDPDALVLSGLAKSHGLAGWRLGWLIVPAPLSAPLTALHQQLVTSASTLVQRGALAALAPDEPTLPALAARLADNRALALSLLDGQGGWTVAASGGAFYLWVRHPRFDDDVALCRALMREAGVVTIPGSAFGPEGVGYLRLSVSVDAPILRDALGRLVAFGAAQVRGDDEAEPR